MTRRGLVVVAVGIVTTLLVALVWWARLPEWRPALRSGERFGVDVSAHQGTIDWPAVGRDHIGFAYVKATEGSDFTDRRFAINWRGAERARLDVGAYHYFTLCTPGAAQARHFLSIVPPRSRALVPALDLEDLDGACNPDAAAVNREIAAFLAVVERAWGTPVMLYIGSEFDDAFRVRRGGRPIWNRHLLQRPPADDWVIWQAHWRARVAGVDGDVDLNVGMSPLPRT